MRRFFYFGGGGIRPHSAGRGLPCRANPSNPAATQAVGLLSPYQNKKRPICMRRFFLFWRRRRPPCPSQWRGFPAIFDSNPLSYPPKSVFLFSSVLLPRTDDLQHFQYNGRRSIAQNIIANLGASAPVACKEVVPDDLIGLPCRGHNRRPIDLIVAAVSPANAAIFDTILRAGRSVLNCDYRFRLQYF